MGEMLEEPRFTGSTFTTMEPILHLSLEAHPVTWLERVHTDNAGTPKEQTKAKLLDPSGNVMEIKSYADLAAGLQAV